MMFVLTALPIPEISRYEPFAERQARGAIVHIFALAVAGTVISWAAQTTHRRRPWLNLFACAVVGVVGSAADWGARSLQRARLESDDERRTLWKEHQLELRFAVFYWVDWITLGLAAYILERSGSIWPGSGRWIWTSSAVLLPLTLVLNASDVQASARAAAIRQTLSVHKPRSPTTSPSAAIWRRFFARTSRSR